MAGKFCELCFSTAHMARECGMAADDVDVAYGWRMVKSVVGIPVRSPTSRTKGFWNWSRMVG